MSEFKAIDLSTIEDRNPTFDSNLGKSKFIDADTVKLEDGRRIRISDIVAPEVQHVDRDKGTISRGEWGGVQLTNELSTLRDQGGYNIIELSGEKDKYKRELGRLVNAGGESLGDRATYEGITDVGGYSDAQKRRQQSLSDAGWFKRSTQNVEDGDIWQASRDRLEETARNLTMVNSKGEIAYKQTAMNERELGDYVKYADDGTFGVYNENEVQYRHSGQDIYGEANNAFTSGIGAGLSNIHESFYGAASAIGDLINNQSVHDWGQAGAKSVEFGERNRGSFINTIGDVSSLGEFGRFVAGMAGQSLPYLVGLIGSAGAGTLVAGATGWAALGTTIAVGTPSLVYAGEIYNGMEGDMSEKNVAYALAGGVAAATLDRLGLNKLLKTSDLLKKDAKDQLVKAYIKKNGGEVADVEVIIAKAMAAGQKELLETMGGAVALQLNKAALLKVAGRSVLEGAVVEAGTEAGQEGIIYGAQVGGSNKEFDSGEFGDILVNAATGGFLLGGGLSGSIGTTSSASNFNQTKHNLGLADTKHKEGFYANEVSDQALEDIAVEEESAHGLDVEAGKADYKEGQEADKFKNKGIVKSVTELPSRFLRKAGAILEGKYIGNINEKATKILHTLTANFANSNVSAMAGTNFGKIKRYLTSRLKRENNIIKNEIFQLMGLRTDKAFGQQKSAKAASLKLSKFMQQKAAVKAGEMRLLDMDSDFINQHSEWNNIADRMTKLTDTLRDVVEKQSGDQVGYKDDYFATAIKLNKKMILANKEEFVELVRQNLTKDNGASYTSAEAESFANAILEGPAGYDPANLHRLGFNNVKEQGNLQEAMSDLENVPGIDQFVNPDKFEQMAQIIEENVNFAVDMKVLGKNGEKVDLALAALKREMGDQWDPRIATWVKDHIAAQRGDYKPIKNKAWKETQAWITWFNTLTQLDTSVLASIPELATIMMGTSGKQNTALIGDATKGVFKQMSKTFRRNLSKAVKNSGYTEEEIMSAVEDFYRYGYDAGAQGAVAQIDIDFGDGKGAEFRRYTMEAFFKANLLAPFTDATRISRLSMANDAIFADIDIINSFYNENGSVTNYAADAFARLRDLNIDPVEFSSEFKSILEAMPTDVKQGGTEAMYRYLRDNHSEEGGFMNKLDLARKSFVDNALANPNATDRPIWYSNPHFRLLTQYQGFLSTFTSHILPRIWKNVKAGNPSARYNAVAIAATMLALGFLGQEGKDEIKRDGQTPPGLSDTGYVQRGITASGLLGTGERWLNIVHPIYGKKFRNPIDIISDELGPTTGSGRKMAQFFKAVAEGDDAKAALYGNKLTPGKGVYDAYKTILGGE